MAIRDELRTILDGYVQARQKEPFPGPFRPVFDRLAQAIGVLPSVASQPGLRVRAGFGIGQWSRLPWVVVLHPRASTSPQDGVFINIMFRQDMAGFYLSINQGHAREIAELGRKVAREAWSQRANAIRPIAGDLASAGFRLDGEIDLKLDDANAAADFRASTIAWRYHDGADLPDDLEFDREFAALIGVYMKWLAGRHDEEEPFSETALAEMKQIFLKHMTGFVSFIEPGIYEEQERAYKVELAQALRQDVLTLLREPIDTVEQGEAAISALNELLTRRKVGPEQAVQNLVSWRATEHLRKLQGEEALQAARLYAALLGESSDTPERAEAFTSGYLPILGRYMKSGLQGVSRSMPTLLLMLADPQREIFIRTMLFDDAAKRLLGHRLLSGEPLNAGDYAACRRFAERIREALEGWGWQPKDMIDVQGFLWVADPTSYGEPAADSDDLAFKEALDPQSERRIYKIAPGEQGRMWEDCRRGGYICVGWDNVGDLRAFTNDDEESFAAIFREKEGYTGSSGLVSTGTRKARELWTLRELEPGDIILANRGIGEILAMGEVIEPGYSFDESRQEYKHVVRVRWNEGLRRELSLDPRTKTLWSNNTVVPVERELYAAILEGRPLATAAVESSDAYAEPPFDAIATTIHKTGLQLNDRMVRRYHTAVKARGFVILAGVSGTGKTWLAEAYADAIGARLLVVRVAPNWNSNEDLLGFTSPLNGEYQHTAFSRFLVEADEAFRRATGAGAVRPFYVLLDEMNLARVEHYFAEFLSALEQRNRYGEAVLDLGGERVGLHRNLVFVGTVNMDETTHGFAHKVYDRSQLIELELDPALFGQHIRGRPYAEDLERIRAAVSEAAPIAFRTADDIALYVDTASTLEADWRPLFDEAVLQKVLPRIRGIDPAVGEALEQIVEITEDVYPLSHAKAKRMLEGFRLGIASFF